MQLDVRGQLVLVESGIAETTQDPLPFQAVSIDIDALGAPPEDADADEGPLGVEFPTICCRVAAAPSVPVLVGPMHTSNKP